MYHKINNNQFNLNIYNFNNNISSNKMNLFNNNNNTNFFNIRINAYIDGYYEEFQIDFRLDRYNLRIYIDCYPIDASLSLYNYNLNLAVNDFYNLGKSFRQCDDIYQIFGTLRNIFSSQNNINIEISNNDDITLVIPNRLSYGSMENIRILFIKNDKNITSQFYFLRRNYLKLKHQK